MKIVGVSESWIHTHFATDGKRLSDTSVRSIEREITGLLRQLGIVYGVHLEQATQDPGIRIVLECRPLASDLEQVRCRLSEILAPIPRRPPVTEVHLPAEAGADAEAGW